MSKYSIMRSKEGPSKNKSTFESGALSKDKNQNEVMLDSDSPNRSNYFKYKNEEDAQEAYDSLQAESEMRAEMGIKKGGKVKAGKISTHKKSKSALNW
jgi:hypothetical protein